MSGRPVGFLLRRYVVPREGNLLSMALWICVVGVALGIALLMLVLGVMSGFQGFLKDSYTRITSEMVVLPRHSHERQTPVRQILADNKDVVAVTPFSLSQAMLIKQGVAGVTVEGVSLDTFPLVTPTEKIFHVRPDEALQNKNENWIWLGTQLAAKLNAKVGDTVDLLVAEEGGRRVLPFVVTAITRFGIYDHDLRYARIALPVLNRLFPTGSAEPMYKLKLRPGADEKEVAEALRRKVDKLGAVRLWSEIHQNVFLAVAHQKRMLFVVLEIIVALAAMNLVNLLLMSAHQRKRDVAILRAMGMKLGQVFNFFLWQGAIVGVAGIGLGVGLGVVLSRAVERWQPTMLNESIYNVTRLPIKTDPMDVAAICVAAFGLCLIFSLWPAYRAAKSRPVEALRYE